MKGVARVLVLYSALAAAQVLVAPEAAPGFLLVIVPEVMLIPNPVALSF